MQWLTFPDPFSLDDIVGRYDSLSRSVSERNEKLQVTVTRSLSVQDGLDEMLDWMGRGALPERGRPGAPELCCPAGHHQ